MKVESLVHVPGADDAAQVRRLVAEGESTAAHGPESPTMTGGGFFTLLLGGLLTTNPKKEEPVEDAFGGVVQELAFA